jgi:hypothetical protein
MCGRVYEVVKCDLMNGMEQKRKKRRRMKKRKMKKRTKKKRRMKKRRMKKRTKKRTLKMRKTMRTAKKGERSEAPQNLDRKKRQQLKEGADVEKRLSLCEKTKERKTMVKKRIIKVFFPFGCPFLILSSSPPADIADTASEVTVVIVVAVVVDVAAAEDRSSSSATALAVVAVALVSPAVPYPSAVPD